MNAGKTFDGFYFNNHSVIYKKIKSVTTVNLYIFVG